MLGRPTRSALAAAALVLAAWPSGRAVAQNSDHVAVIRADSTSYPSADAATRALTATKFFASHADTYDFLFVVLRATA